MTRQCGTCGAPLTDQAHLCTGCTGALTLDLQRIGGYRHTDGRWIPGLLTDLLTTATHGAVIPSQGGSADDDTTRRTLDSRWPATTAAIREPANTAALALHHEITTDLIGWVRILLGETVVPNRNPYAWTRPARWLEHRTTTIRRHDWAPAMLTDLDRHITRTERLIDLPDALTVPCPWCTRRVPIDPDADIIECQCGCWGVLDWWIDQVAPPLPTQPMTLAELVPWLRTRGYEVTPKQVENWADRGRLPSVGGGGQGSTRLFAARTVLEVAEQSGTRRVIPTSLTL